MPDGGDAGSDAGRTPPDAGDEAPAVLGGLLVISDSDDENSPANLDIVRPDGGLICQITNNTNWNRNAGWSADGTKIVWNVRNSTGGIWIMDSDLSLFEASLYCLVEHLRFRPTLPIDRSPSFGSFARSSE